MLTEKEIDAVRFYQGDVRKRTKDGTYSELLTEPGFWGISSAYKTMNCLMFDGVENEKERIAEKADSLNPQIYLEIEKVVDVFCHIFRAMCKSSADRKDEASIIAYRTDRGISVQEMRKQGQTISFTSTSKDNCPKEYFRRKKKLTLLEIVIPPGIPYLDFEKVLGGDYYYADQKEILLPPFLKADFFEKTLTAEEETYKDADQLPPQGKYTVVLKDIAWQEEENITGEGGNEWGKLAEEKEKMAVFLLRLSKGEILTQQEIQEYCEWKKDFRVIISKKFYEIQRKYSEEEHDVRDSVQAGRQKLIEEVEQTIKSFDARRKSYKGKMHACNIALAAMGIVPLVCIALSFIQGLETGMKIAAIVTSAAAMFLTRMFKAEIYHLKLLQRTKTCLSLRDLARQIRYECRWDEQKMGEYVHKFRMIMNEDTSMSLQNIQLQVDSEDELFQNEIVS